MNDLLEHSKSELLADPAKLKKHLDTLDANAKLHWADEHPEILRNLYMEVQAAKDAELTLKFAKFMTEYLGWGAAAKKVDDPKDRLPVFHITFHKADRGMTISAANSDTDEVVDVFTMDAATPTPSMVQSLLINDELGDLDA